MANEKVTQMVELSAGEMVGDDLFLIVDHSARESKKLKASALVTFVQSSGSFDAWHADLADTASYVDPANVGLIPSASSAIWAFSSSWANTASILAGGTASYALKAGNTTGSVDNAKSASYLIYSSGNGTASYATKLKTIERIVRSCSIVQEEAVAMCTVAGWSFFAHMGVSGIHCACSKTYFIGLQYTSPGVQPPYGYSPHGATPPSYNGWFTVKPLSAPHEYPYSDNQYTDFDLEASQSNVHQVTLRIRTVHNNVVTATPTASLYIWGLDQTTNGIIVDTTETAASSNALPAWGSSFVSQLGNYRFIISGSAACTNGFTGSLIGTSSNAIYSETASYNLGGTVESASFTETSRTASMLVMTASHAYSSSYLNYLPGFSNGTSSYSIAAETSITASHVDRGSPNIVKAWANLSWDTASGTFNDFTIHSSHNIYEIKLLDYHDFGAGFYCPFLFGIRFENSLPSTNYTMVGNAQKQYGGTAVGTINSNVIIPQNSDDFPKYTNGCTMSVSIDGAYLSSWWYPSLGPGSNWYDKMTGSVSFMIVGTD